MKCRFHFHRIGQNIWMLTINVTIDGTDDVQLAEQQSLSQEVFEDTGNIGVIRIRKSKKDRQHNG